MTLFGKKEKEEEEASAADTPTTPKSTFQSASSNTLKVSRKTGLKIPQPYSGKILKSPETFPAKAT